MDCVLLEGLSSYGHMAVLGLYEKVDVDRDGYGICTKMLVEV